MHTCQHTKPPVLREHYDSVSRSRDTREHFCLRLNRGVGHSGHSATQRLSAVKTQIC